MAKKKEEKEGLAADFFGDDAEWLDDEEDEDDKEDSEEEHLPVAPPPAPAAPEPLAAMAESWGDKVTAAPKDPMSSAPTLHFSSVPTLPPIDMQDTEGALPTEDAPTATSPLPPVAPPPPVPPEMFDLAPEGAEPPVKGSSPDPAPAEPAPAEPAPEPVAEPVAEAPAAVEPAAEEPAAEPLTPIAQPADSLASLANAPTITADPPPARVYVPTPEPAPRVAPPVRVERWAPRGDEESWRDVAVALVSEAAVNGEDRGELLYAAARVHRSRLGDDPAAIELFQDAAAAGCGALGMYREHVLALRSAGRDSETAAVLEAGALAVGGVDGADLLLEAVEVLRDSEPARAIELARKATELAPDDYAAWTALRDLISEAPVDERLAVMERLASLSSGWAAAEALLEGAGMLFSVERVADAIPVLQAARAAAPDHGTVFAVLEDALREVENHGALAVLYAAEAEREGARDTGWWWLQAARALKGAEQADAADAAYGKSVAAGYLFVERERQAAALKAQAWERLGESLEREADAVMGPARAFAKYRLGDLRERKLGDLSGALDAYRAAVVADGAAGPAADGVARLLSAQGKHDELRELWSVRLASSAQGTRAPMNQRLAEVCEAAGDDANALEHYQAAAAEGGPAERLAAASGIARALHRAGRWADLGEHWARQATNSDDASEKADLLFRAATVGQRDAQDDAAAADRLREILALEPTHYGALFELTMRLETLQDWKGLAQTLDDAGDATDGPIRRAVLKYRAARVRLERGVDTDRVRAGLERAVADAPEFLPAVWTLRQAVASDAEATHASYQLQAENSESLAEAAWAGFAASLLAEDGGRADLRALLDQQPDHVGARSALECLAHESGDRAALAALWQAALAANPESPRLALALAALWVDMGQVPEATDALEELASSQGDERPLRAAARVAEGAGAFRVAASLLEQLGDREDQLQRARIICRRIGEAPTALPMYRALFDAHPDDADVAFGAAIVAAMAGDRDLLTTAHERVARVASALPARAASARWAATLHEGTASWSKAAELWGLDLELRPSRTAFAGVERARIKLRDLDGIEKLYADHAPTRAIALSESLSSLEGTDRAVRVLSAALQTGTPKLPIQLHLEQALSTAGDWQRVYDALTARREGTLDEGQKSTIDARRRWVLAEHLADTDAAWDLYRKLHEEAPSDREVTEALARIAGARGETGMAIQYLKELAESTADTREAARYQRRVGEVYERNNDLASARQAYLDALDHDNDDREALDGLRRLAEREEDWPGLIQVHQREVGIADEARVVELKRAIAQVTEQRLGEPAVAMDAWRGLLEVAPDDREAMTQMMALAEALGEWGSYVEVGTRLADAAVGREKTTLLRRVGVACQEQLERDDAVRFYEQAIRSDTPDIEAARRLETLYRARGDWGGTIRALVVQADNAESPDDKAPPLVRAAQLELEVRHDRASASEFYQRVLDVAPEHEGALRFMASHLFQTKRFEAARPVYERLAPRVEQGQDLDDFDTRMELAAFYFAFAEMLVQDGRGAEALKHYERALELNPSHQSSLEAAGPLYTAASEWKKAEKVYRQLLQLTGGQGERSKVAQVYSQLGVVERELGNNDKAYKRFNKALELHPNHVGALKGMALVLEDREDWSNLLNVFNNIIYHASVPNDVVAAYMTKGRILDNHMSRPDKAAQHYQRSLDFDNKQPGALLRMAELAMRRDAYDEARVLAEKGLSLPDALVEPHRDLLELVLAGCLKGAGQPDEAKTHLGAIGKETKKALGSKPLDDLEKLRQFIKDRL